MGRASTSPGCFNTDWHRKVLRTSSGEVTDYPHILYPYIGLTLGFTRNSQPFIQRQTQQLAAAAQLAGAGAPTAASNNNSPPGGSGGGGGVGGSYQLDAANAAKQMAALQAAGRSRAQSNSSNPNIITPTSSSITGSGLPPIAPSMNQHDQPQQPQQQQQHANPAMDPQTRAQILQVQNQIMHQLLNNRPPHFLPQLAEVMAQHGTPLPPALTGIQSPGYDPNTSRLRAILPGSTTGTFHLYGKEVDLHMLLVWIIQRGGGVKVGGVCSSSLNNPPSVVFAASLVLMLTDRALRIKEKTGLGRAFSITSGFPDCSSPATQDNLRPISFLFSNRPTPCAYTHSSRHGSSSSRTRPS